MEASPLQSVIKFLEGRELPPDTESFDLLAEAIRHQLHDAVVAIIFYGSVVHGLSEKEDALHDLLVIVKDYRSAYKSPFLRIANWVLPPNVFYLEAGSDDKKCRCKYTIISERDFDKYTKTRCRQVYFWGRYSQPCLIGYTESEEARSRVIALLAQASATFAMKTLSLTDPEFRAMDLWEKGLSACYGSELRPEDPQRAKAIVARDSEYFRTLALILLPLIGVEIKDMTADNPLCKHRLSPFTMWWFDLGWTRRRIEGKLLNFLRLLKAVFTFEGGVDYALWKINRHSEHKIEVSERVRKHPLIFGWPTLFKLFRLGVFSRNK